jgi:DNA-binding HxlR family transcriptional regulator
MSVKNLSKPGCLECALKVVGDKWTPLILRDLTASMASFSQLERSLDGISPRTLSQRLNKLENEKIILKELYCEHPPRYQYGLTIKGKELQALLVQMANWGARHSSE